MKNGEKEHVRNGLSDLSLLTGAAGIFFMFSILLISIVSFALRVSLSWFHIPLSAVATVLFCFVGARLYFRQNVRRAVLAIILPLSLFFILSLYVCGTVYDLSYDGQSYQQEAVIQLKEGWNPLYNPVTYSVAMLYTKGQWIYEAALYRLTGNIEQAKVFNFLWIASSFFLAVAALLRIEGIKYGLAVALAFLFACNPVSIYQSLSFYVDGQLASSLTSLLAVSCLLATRPDKFTLSVYFMILAIGINLKLPFIAYAGTFGTGLLLHLFMAGKRKMLPPVAVTGLLALVVGTCFLGFNPYGQNLLKHGNPFYPFIGPKAVNYMGSADTPGNRPANFNAMNRFERLFHATFSETSNACLTVSSSPKWPFTVTKSELDYNWIGDARVGGFGPLFGGTIIIAAIILPGALAARSPGAGYGAGIVLAIVLSVLLHREAWWARYAPQLYLVPIIAVMLSLKMRSPLGRAGGYLLIAILAANLLLVSWPYFRSAHASSRNLAQQLRHLSSKPGPLHAYFGHFIPYRIRLKDMGIAYIQVKSASELPCRFPAAAGSISLCPGDGGMSVYSRPPDSGQFSADVYVSSIDFKFKNADVNRGDYVGVEIPLSGLRKGMKYELSLEVGDSHAGNSPGRIEQRVLIGDTLFWKHDIGEGTYTGWSPVVVTFTASSEKTVLRIEAFAAGSPERGSGWGQSARTGVRNVRLVDRESGTEIAGYLSPK